MISPTEKQRNRDAVLFHLNAIKSSGVDYITVSGQTLQNETAEKNLPDPAGIKTDDQDEDSAPPAATACVPVARDLSAINTLEDLNKAIAGCQNCALCKERKNVVFGQGNPRAALMFVGEGPGADEDMQGLAFVGAAGQLLTKIIAGMGLSREEVYIANVVKCRPPQNRNPFDDEIAACLPILKRQIQIVSPKVIMCLGKIAAQTLLETQISISRLRGQFKEIGDIKVMPSFHPAYLLRNPAMKRPMWEDCKLVMKELGSTLNHDGG
ncbi:MAG: uracil-DNA glycosylase [Deltaproteobacteria bacterium]|nr:uracil-DNA glycosylase [Deltaproteobacteria bacterium]